MVQDELLTLAMYCGPSCTYPIPLLGTFTLYDAETATWTFVGIGVLLTTLSIGTLLSELYERPPHGKEEAKDGHDSAGP